MYTFEELEEIARKRDEARRTGVSIDSNGSGSWRVTVVIGRSSENRKLVRHEKTIRGTKKEAQLYGGWVKSLANAGQFSKSAGTISQAELKELHALQAKADRFRYKLKAAVRAGSKVEPGALNLGD